MRKPSRLALTAALPLVLASGIASAQPALVEGLVPSWVGDFGGETGTSIRQEERRSEDFDRKAEVVARRTVAKQRVVRSLIEGRLTLLEAAAWFGELNRGADLSRGCFQTWADAPSEGERLCRQVISWSRGELQAYPESQARAEVARFESELRDALARGNGKVELPGDGR